MSWLLAFLGFAALIILHEAGHFAAAKAVGMRVERFSLFFPPLAWRWRPRGSETEYAVGWVPLGGYVKITGMNPNEEIAPEHAHRAYFRQPVWKRIFVISAGPAVNLVLAFLIFWALFWANGVGELSRSIGTVERGYPAAGVLQVGDELVSVAGRGGTLAELSRRIATEGCAEARPDAGCRRAQPVSVTIRRDGRLRTLELTPRYDPALERLRLGFSYAVERQSVGPLRAADLSVDTMWDVTTATVSAIARLFYSEQAREDISGVVGSYEYTRQAVDADLVLAVRILGLISLSLAVINLFPFLPLDGGHIFWAVAEKLRGRAIAFRTMERASVVGFLLVIFLFFIGLTNDIERIANDEIRIR